MLRAVQTELGAVVAHAWAGYLTNVSVWDSLERAHQTDTFELMLKQRPILEAAGIQFEVITNHETLWTISP